MTATNGRKGSPQQCSGGAGATASRAPAPPGEGPAAMASDEAGADAAGRDADEVEKGEEMGSAIEVEKEESCSAGDSEESDLDQLIPSKKGAGKGRGRDLDQLMPSKKGAGKGRGCPGGRRSGRGRGRGDDASSDEAADRQQSPSSDSSSSSGEQPLGPRRPPRPLLVALHSYMKMGLSPSEGVIDRALANFRRVQNAPFLRLRSLPTNLDALQSSGSSTPSRQRPPPGRPRLTLSQARLIIPRSESEYVECCRFTRSHSEGLLFASTPAVHVTGAMKGCRDIVPRALSEGLLGGRLRAARPRSRPKADSEPKEVPLKPVEELKVGDVVEGRIVRIARIGFFIDVHATRPGLLTRRQCRIAPKGLLKKGEIFSNLVVLSVNTKKRQFTLGLYGIGRDDNAIEEVRYDLIFRRVAAWAGCEIPRKKLQQVLEDSRKIQALGKGGKGRGKGRGGRGRGQPRRVWREVRRPPPAEANEDDQASASATSSSASPPPGPVMDTE